MVPIYKDPPSGTKNPSPAERLPVTFNAYTLNDPAGTAESSIELVETAVTPITDQVIENKQGRDGMEVYQAFKSGLMIRMRGWIKRPTLAALHDEALLMAEKFDAALLSRKTQLTTIGFLPLSFSVPTADTANYPSGLVPSFYLARTMEPITFGRTKYDGYSIPYRIEMIARNPSRFFETVQTYSVPESSGALNNTLARYPSDPTFTMTMTGPGAINFTIRNDSAVVPSAVSKYLMLKLDTLIAGDVVRVEFETKRIFVNNVLRMGLYGGGGWWQIEPRATNNVYAVNVAGTSARTISWYRAFPL